MLFLIMGLFLTFVILYKKRVDRQVTQQNAGSIRARYTKRRDPFGGDLEAMEMNRGDLEAMEMNPLPPVAEIQADVHQNQNGDQFVNPTGN